MATGRSRHSEKCLVASSPQTAQTSVILTMDKRDPGLWNLAELVQIWAGSSRKYVKLRWSDVTWEKVGSTGAQQQVTWPRLEDHRRGMFSTPIGDTNNDQRARGWHMISPARCKVLRPFCHPATSYSTVHFWGLNGWSSLATAILARSKKKIVHESRRRPSGKRMVRGGIDGARQTRGEKRRERALTSSYCRHASSARA